MTFLEIGTLVIAFYLVAEAAVYMFYDPLSAKPHGILAVAAIFLFANKLLLGMYVWSLLDVALFVWNFYMFSKAQ